MKILVCGGRRFDNAELVNAVLDSLHAKSAITTLIHGNATGADGLAAEWAESRGVACEAFPANWEKHGPAAGPIRNQEMLEQHPDLVLAFPGGRGTNHMSTAAMMAGVKTILACYSKEHGCHIVGIRI